MEIVGETTPPLEGNKPLGCRLFFCGTSAKVGLLWARDVESMESMELELAGDDQCESGDDCALNALQVGIRTP